MLESRLKEILDERGLKYGFVAKKVGIANSTMSSLVNGGSPTMIVGLRIAKLLQLHVEDIWFEQEEKADSE